MTQAELLPNSFLRDSFKVKLFPILKIIEKQPDLHYFLVIIGVVPDEVLTNIQRTIGNANTIIIDNLEYAKDEGTLNLVRNAQKIAGTSRSENRSNKLPSSTAVIIPLSIYSQILKDKDLSKIFWNAAFGYGRRIITDEIPIDEIESIDAGYIERIKAQNDKTLGSNGSV